MKIVIFTISLFILAGCCLGEDAYCAKCKAAQQHG